MERLPLFLTAAMLWSFIATCAAPQSIFVDEDSTVSLSNEKITRVTLTTGEVIQFEREGARYRKTYQNERRVIVGRTEEGRWAVIALDEVLKVRIEKETAREDVGGMIFPTVLIVGLVVSAASGKR